MPETNNVPEVPELQQTPITPGRQTSEYKIAGGVQVIGTIVSLIGSVGVVAAPLIESNQDKKWAIIASCVLAIAGQVSKTLSALGYANARATVKASPYTR